jgi:hypothetical protein
MNMAANIVEYTVNPESAETLHERVRNHLVPAARQASGYQGFLLVDRGAGSRLAVVLFDSAANAQIAQETLAPIGIEQTGSLMQGPIQRSVGTVVFSDGAFADAAAR